MSEATRSLLILIGINTLLAWGAYIVLKTGQLSLGQAGFMAIGGYGAGVLTGEHGFALIPATLIAGAVAAAVGVLLGFPALRLRGLYLALLTIGFGELVVVGLANWDYVGGVSGLPVVGGTSLGLVWGCVAVALVFLVALGRSRLGWAMDAVREDDVAAASLGVNVTYIKLLAFALGGFVTAFAGALYANYQLFIQPGNFDFSQSVLIVLYVVLGGAETFIGPAVGAAVLTWLPELIRDLQEWRLFVYGALLVAVMAVRPQGLISRQTLHTAVAPVRTRGDKAGKAGEVA
jgi:branched-chain amino acid transport system permease protein